MNAIDVMGYFLCGLSGYLMGVLIRSLEGSFQVTLMAIGLIVLAQIGTGLILMPRK
jgi:cyanate permease